MRRPPARDGLTPTRLVLPHDAAARGRYPTAVSYLYARFPRDVERLRAKVADGDVLDEEGRSVTESTPYRPRGFLYVHRDPPVEPVEPYPIEVLHRDRDLLVVDKPHFVATMPRGAHVTRSALVRLRRELDLPDLSPVHRLDRVTAGVLLFTIRPPVRGAYQLLFQRRQVRKVYEAVAPWRAELSLPATVCSRIVKDRGVLRSAEVEGEPNAESRIEVVAVDVCRGLGRYRLIPRTGRTHQLRLHMCSLGIPILYDPFYPELRDGPDDPNRPLQLVARSLEFTDPLSGEPRRFESRLPLTAWRG